MEKAVSIVPYPFLLKEKQGIFNISNEKKLSFFSDFSKKTNTAFINLFKKYTNFTFSYSSEKCNINFIRAESFQSYYLKEDESYCMSIEENSISIWAYNESGAFYGAITLLQLVMTYNLSLPTLFIYDKPKFNWRGLLLDTSRSFYTVDFIKKVLDLCAFHKLNVFHWHLTDDQGWRIPIKGYPLLTEIGSKRNAARKPLVYDGLNEDNVDRRQYYTEEEILDIIKYAEERFITVVPEIELPGHASALLASYPEYGCTRGPYQVEHRWGIFPDVLCAGNDKIFELYDSIFETVCRLFPGKYIHIGGDECRTKRWDKCPRCQQRIKEQGLDNSKQLQTWVTAKMVELLEKRGKIPIGWDEVIDNTEKIPVPQDLIVQSWRGIEGGEKAARLNHSVIMSPQDMCYLNLKPYNNFEEPGMLGYTTIEKAYKFSPITKDMDKEKEHLVMGGECALWTEELRSSRLAEYLMFPRLCALSECLWLPESHKDFDRLLYNLKDHKNRLDELDVLYYKGPAKETK